MSIAIEVHGKWVYIEDVVCLKATDSALLCEIDSEEIWFPLSQINESESEVVEALDSGRLVVSKFICEKKGLL